MHNYLKHLLNFFLPYNAKWDKDCLSGLTVALALIPEAIAFSLVAHVDPLVGLYAAFLMCLITAILGGRPGMISGATGATAVVFVALVDQHGIEYLFAAVVLSGIFQIFIGVFKLGQLIRLLPKPVMVGFVNGLAIVIFLAQLEQFKVDGNQWLTGSALYLMLGLVMLAMLITHFLPRFTKKLPSALVAILTVTAIVHLFHIDTRVVADMMTHPNMTAGLPSFSWIHVPLTWDTLKIIAPYSAIICIVGLSESLMTLSLIDEITQTRGRANKECIAQGIANIVCGFFKAMGGCVMLGQSMININSGGRGRLSSTVAAIALLLFLITFWSIIKEIPLAALVGVMFMVVIATFEWATFKFIRKIPKNDAAVIIIVTLVTVFTDLAVAVVIGVIIAALVFVWQTAKNIHTTKFINDKGEKEYQLHGPLFFGSVAQFKTLFDFEHDPQEVIIDFAYSRVTDHSALDAIQFISSRYVSLGKSLHLRHLSPECKQLLGKVGSLVEINVLEDPDYHIATDLL